MAANITIDIPIENDIKLSVVVVDKCSLFEKNKYWKQITKIENKKTKAPIM